VRVRLPPPAPLKATMFIAFEGIDGSGKTTLSKLLYRELLERKIPSVWTYEPNDNRIREILKGNKLDPWSETCLFLADRREHVLKFVKPKLENGFWVISDRYYLSTLAYQGYGRGLPLEKLWELNKLAIQNCEPDLWVYLDVPIEVAMERLEKRRMDHFENLEFLEKVKKGFKELIKGLENVIKLDGTKSPGENLKLLVKSIL
jgi:dTMP kinase